MTNLDNLSKWLILNRIPDLGVVGGFRLWKHFESIEAIFNANQEVLETVEGIHPRIAQSIVENRGLINVDKELKQIGAIEALTFDFLNYPKSLLNIYDPPSILYCKDGLVEQDQKAIAIVGTRRASHYGLEIAKKLAAELSALGFTIISGMALGIDTAAHEGALQAGGRTIAVLGTGVDVIYPPSNKNLYHSIVEKGAVVSELLPGTAAEQWTFPRRNRIISGLSLGVIVVEGHYDSGAMITAKCALDQGREVFAIPGQIGIDQSKGPHWLIKQGAKLVETIDDILEELNFQIPIHNFQTIPNNQTLISKPDYLNLSVDEQKIVATLSLDPKYIDNIAHESGMPISQVSSLLMMLEMNKAVRQLSGKYYVKFA
ncbi:MAG: DNA-processing protein DprA [Candidatus Margulisiibacteriota bacterium]